MQRDQLKIRSRALSANVAETRVHRSVFRDPEIFKAEQKAILERSWIYLGHESEIREPGDFIVRDLVGQPVIIVRNADGRIEAWFNTCRHRGALLCRADTGNLDRFRCLYHGWTYGLNGKLMGVPGLTSYPKEFDRDALSLVPVPRLDIYQGLIFGSLNAEVRPLIEALGGACPYLDMALGQGEGSLVRGIHRFEVQANWKLVTENTIDGYHPPILHSSVGLAGIYSRGNARDLGDGHGLLEWQTVQAKSNLGNALGTDRTDTSFPTNRVLHVFPTLLVLHINDAINLRRVVPLTVNSTRIEAAALVWANDDPQLQSRRVAQYSAGWGPSGIAGADDIEVYEACQRGLEATAVEWSDISKGFLADDDCVGDLEDETAIRGLYRAWRQAMEEYER